MTSTESIAWWAVLGTASGGAFGLVTRRLLLTRSFGWSAWATAAALTGLLFAALAWRIGQHHALLPFSYLAAALVPLAVVDLAEHRLPSALILPSYPILGAGFTAVAVLEPHHANLARALLGMAILAATYFALALCTGGLGAGDIKLAGLLGLALGWCGWSAILAGTLLGWLLAAVARLVLRGTHRIPRHAPMPLGPYLALGAMAAVISTSLG
ncbi:prepilin peptidase [Actinokineospora auranticolor]|uniref:prepilin peptidase n=1 Tax=Actinokineospora auranticolor TaxID=155976 RepID=UPI0015E284FE|nr:prepilin peptidase [Actinokineospora auranticolor]